MRFAKASTRPMSNQDNGLVLVALRARVLRTSEALSPVVFLDAKNDRWLNVAIARANGPPRCQIPFASRVNTVPLM